MTTFGELNLEIKRGRPSHHRAGEQPSGKRPSLLVCTQVLRHSLSDREPLALIRLPHFAEGFLQLLPVGCVALFQVLQLVIFFLVQDPQEIL